MSTHNSSLVNLSIPNEVTQPIVAAKIQEAVLAALGGSEKIVAGVIHQICNTKVDSNGQVNRYESDNKHTWLDYHVTKIIQEEVKKELIEQIKTNSQAIKDELIKQLQSKKGSHKVAEALLSALDGTFGKGWTSSIQISFASGERD
jgi:ABC-type Zn uptake system ZnuABC Zn-binding protein ZnuA